MTATTAMVAAAVAIVVVMLVTWLISLPLRNASIVDITWGLGFVVVAWVVRFQGDTNTGRQWLLVAMTTVWGLRLAGYLFWRNHGQPEDYRYRAMRKRWATASRRQPAHRVRPAGVLMWIVSLPVQLGQVSDSPDVGIVAPIGVAHG
ncbi:MAG: DUF1295 domain-containing protein [Ilumatobacteraceae bacterium]